MLLSANNNAQFSLSHTSLKSIANKIQKAIPSFKSILNKGITHKGKIAALLIFGSLTKSMLVRPVGNFCAKAYEPTIYEVINRSITYDDIKDGGVHTINHYTGGDITYKKFNDKNFDNTKPTIIFVHGLGGDYNQVSYYNALLLLETDEFNLVTFDFQCVKSGKDTCSLAQDYEMSALDSVCKRIKGRKILMGLSMGASTILNYLGYLGENTNDIVAAVVESPFTSLYNIKFSLLPKFVKNWIATSFIAGQFRGHKSHPEESIKNIKKDLPILFIHSSTDALIPIDHSRKLYAALKNLGHKNTYLLELSSGTHANYFIDMRTWSITPDGEKYKKAVNAFFKKYEIPYDENSIQESADDFLKIYQP